MKLNKLRLLEKICKEQLEQTLVGLKKEQELLNYYQQSIIDLEQQKLTELELVSQNPSLGFSINNFLAHANQQIENNQYAANECLKQIEIIQEKMRENFQELKQIELLIEKSNNIIKADLVKKEQLILDEMAARNLSGEAG